MDKNVIYTITVTEKLDIDATTGFPDFGSSSVPGWYAKKEDAVTAVENNACDINETCYDYAIIEEIKEGLYGMPLTNHRWFYRFNHNNGKYEPIHEPECLKHFCGFAMG